MCVPLQWLRFIQSFLKFFNYLSSICFFLPSLQISSQICCTWFITRRKEKTCFLTPSAFQSVYIGLIEVRHSLPKTLRFLSVLYFSVQRMPIVYIFFSSLSSVLLLGFHAAIHSVRINYRTGCFFFFFQLGFLLSLSLARQASFWTSVGLSRRRNTFSLSAGRLLICFRWQTCYR